MKKKNYLKIPASITSQSEEKVVLIMGEKFKLFLLLLLSVFSQGLR